MHAEQSSLSQSSAKMGVFGAYIVYGEHGCTGQVGFDMHTMGNSRTTLGTSRLSSIGTCNTNIFLLVNELRELATNICVCMLVTLDALVTTLRVLICKYILQFRQHSEKVQSILFNLQ